MFGEASSTQDTLNPDGELGERDHQDKDNDQGDSEDKMKRLGRMGSGRSALWALSCRPGNRCATIPTWMETGH
jgi:hypothetical protein